MAGHDIFVIGASAGGVEALTALFSTLPADFPGTLFVVIHIPAEAPSMLPQILNRAGKVPASHPGDGDPIIPGRAYIAPPDYHLILEPGYMRVVRGPRENRHRPAIDPLFRSAARAYGQRSVGVVLSGMLNDGTSGLMALKQQGGLAIVQDPDEALYSAMPRNAREHVRVDYCLPIAEIGPCLVSLAHEQVEAQEEVEVSSSLDKEVRIAAMQTNSLNEHEQVGKPSAFSCPECGGVLWEVDNPNFLRFRCRTGHAFSAENVLIEQGKLIEKALWTALKTLDEKVNLSHRLAAQARQNGNELLAQQFLERIEDTSEDARLLRHILLESPFPEQQEKEA